MTEVLTAHVISTGEGQPEDPRTPEALLASSREHVTAVKLLADSALGGVRIIAADAQRKVG